MKKSRRHALGQHFLHNQGVLDRIVRAVAPREDDLIVEIGAGRGALTYRLAERAGRVIAIERDPAFIPILEERRPPNLTIHEADILKVDLKALIGPRPAKVAGNLPYAVSSPILFKVLAEREAIAECHFLIQKEFAERLDASPGCKAYGPLAILTQNVFRFGGRFSVSRGSFQPPPRVESTFLSLIKRERPLLAIRDEARFRRFLFASFAQRRKKLANNLKTLALPLLAESLEISGVDGHLRPEDVPPDAFARLFDTLFFRESHL